jgi:endonuclease/exonuclease/phosphatase (EEP) superfamily protein YafD
MRGVRAVVSGLAALAAAGAAGPTLLAFASSLSWRCDLFTHFRVQYAIALSAAVLLLLLCGRRWLAALASVFLAFNVGAIAPLYVPSGATAVPGSPHLRAVSFNVHDHNTNHGDVVAYLGAAGADIVVVPEATSTWADRIGAVLVGAGYREVRAAREDSFGIAVWSRLPLDDARVLTLGGAGVPAIELTFALGRQPVALLAVHTLPPLSAEYTARRDEMLDAVAAWSRRHSRAIVIGDLNATPWSGSFRKLVATCLVNSQLGHGVQPTWPGNLWPMAIPIDHCLHSPSLVTVDRSTGPFLGSDHRPLHVTLALAGPE